MRAVRDILIFSAAILLVAACDSNTADETGSHDPNEVVDFNNNGQNNDAEVYIASLDSMNFRYGKSLNFRKGDGSEVWVEFWLNDSSQIIKMIEFYTVGTGGTINRKEFYFRDNHKYVTKEYFDDSNEEEMGFVERVTYYKEGKPSITMMRRGSDEDNVEYEQYAKITPVDCSEDRAYKVLGLEGEFKTNFRGIIRNEHMTYLLVGSNDNDGYISSLSIQYDTPTTRKLIMNEASMIGTPLIVSFETTVSEIGLEFQVLTSVEIVK